MCNKNKLIVAILLGSALMLTACGANANVISTDKMQDKSAAIQDENKRLEKEVEDLKAELEQLKSENENLKKDLEEASAEIIEMSEIEEESDTKPIDISDVRVTDITPGQNGMEEITIEYTVDGDIVYEAKMENYVSFDPDPNSFDDNVGIRLLDLNGDGTDEIVCNVYTIGNTLCETAGEAHIFAITKEGAKEIYNSYIESDKLHGLTLGGLNISNGRLIIEGLMKEDGFVNVNCLEVIYDGENVNIMDIDTDEQLQYDDSF